MLNNLVIQLFISLFNFLKILKYYLYFNCFFLDQMEMVLLQGELRYIKSYFLMSIKKRFQSVKKKSRFKLYPY